MEKAELKGASAITHSSPRLGVGIDTVEQGVRENEEQSQDNHSN